MDACAHLRSEPARYGLSVIALTDLLAAVHIGVEACARSLAEPERLADSGAFAWNVGAGCAESCVPAEGLIRAYRAVAAVFWDRLVDALPTDDLPRGREMARCANDFWRHVDRDIGLLVESYRRTATVHRARHVQPLLRLLLRGNVEGLDVSAAAIGLDAPIRGRYAVASLRMVPVSALVAREQIDDLTVFRTVNHDGGVTVVALLGERTLAHFGAVIARAHPGVSGGIGPVVGGLSELGRARELADLALESVADRTEVVVLADRMCLALLLARRDLATEHVACVFGRVVELDGGDRKSLLDTFGTWVSCGGSAVRAAEVLFCHPNTVSNRLRRLERLTGKHLDRPRDLAELVLALDAYLLLARDDHR